MFMEKFEYYCDGWLFLNHDYIHNGFLKHPASQSIALGNVRNKLKFSSLVWEVTIKH